MYTIGNNSLNMNSLNMNSKYLINQGACSLLFESNNELNTVQLNGNIKEVAIMFYQEIIKYYDAYNYVIKFYDLITIDFKNNDIKFIGNDEPTWFKEFSKCLIKILELKAFL